MCKSIKYEPGRGLLLGQLYYSSTKINGAAIYSLINNDVAIEYPDGTTRLMKSDWHDGESFNEPTDEAIEAIALEALAEGLQKSDQLAMQYGRNIPLQFFLIDPFLKSE
jgi:hypothetical protein